MVNKEQLLKLKEPFPYKWRVQSTKYGKSTIVAYIDSRQVQDTLDEVVGPDNWQNEFKLIDGKLFGGIGIQTSEDKWTWKWDTGTESQIEKDKGEVSDAFKRAAVHWGIGRFLYSLSIITLPAGKYKDKEYPATIEGNILWSKEEVNDYAQKLYDAGIVDATKPGVKLTNNGTKCDDSTPTAKPHATKAPKKEDASTLDPKAEALDEKGALKPNEGVVKELMSGRQQRVLQFLKGYEGSEWIVVTAYSKIALKDKPKALAKAQAAKDATELVNVLSAEDAAAVANEIKIKASK